MIMLDREKVGNAIAAQRKMKGMTQRNLADMLNVSYQAVSRWEQGISLPSVDMIYEIAQTLETTVDFLLNGLSAEKKVMTYLDTGLDTKKLYLVKKRVQKLITQDDALLHAHYVDPVFFRLNTSLMEDPVCVFACHGPGSKERFAVEHGYDYEICTDLAANATNNLVRFGVKPTVLQAHVLCGNNDSGQLLIMGEAFKEFCERNKIIFSGMEISAQAVNYQPFEYKTNVTVIGITDKKDILTGKDIAPGDLLIGLHTDGIYATSYPFVKIMTDKKPEMLYAKIDDRHTFVDALMQPNAAYLDVILKLREQNLLHGIFVVTNSLFKRKDYSMLPKGLSACICVSEIPRLPLFRYLHQLDMMDEESFLRNFSLGIGMLVVVPKEHCDRAVKLIEPYHSCSVIGRIEEDKEYMDEKIWMEGKIKW